MSKLKLWEVSDELDAIFNELHEAGGEMTPELEERLAKMSEEFDTKVEWIALKVKEAEANETAAKAEADRLLKIARAFGRSAKSMKGYVFAEMQRQNLDTVKTHRAKVSVVQNSRPSIKWEGDPKKAPFLFQKIAVTIDGNAAYDAWQRDSLPEGFTVEKGSHVRIL